MVAMLVNVLLLLLYQKLSAQEQCQLAGLPVKETPIVLETVFVATTDAPTLVSPVTLLLELQLHADHDLHQLPGGHLNLHQPATSLSHLQRKFTNLHPPSIFLLQKPPHLQSTILHPQFQSSLSQVMK